MALFVAAVLSVVVVVVAFGAFFFFFLFLSDRIRWLCFEMGIFTSCFSNAGQAGGQLDYHCVSHTVWSSLDHDC